MVFSKVRDYIVTSISSVDSSLTKLKGIVDVRNTPESLADNSYSISYNLIGSENGQQTVDDVISAEIQFLFKAFRSGQDAYDDAMDTVNDVRIKLLSQSNLGAFRSTDDFPIQQATSDSLTGEIFETNERQILVTLSVNFLIYQTIC